MTANEAAERLDPNGEPYPEWLTQMLDEEHRATVERLRNRYGEVLGPCPSCSNAVIAYAILDEEAVR